MLNMPRVSKVWISALALLALSVAGCTASVEDRVKSWDRAQTLAASMKTKHPNFASVIDLQTTEAKAAWEKAMAISDDKEKAEALGVASGKLSKLANRISEVDAKALALNEEISKLAKIKLPKSKADQRRDAMDAASAKVGSVRTAMNEASPLDQAAAMLILDKQVSTLITGTRNIERTIKNLKPKKAKKKKAKKGKKSS